MNAPERLTLLEPAALQGFADERWDQAIVPALHDYIAIPAKSPMFDAQWAQAGLLDQVARNAAAWVESRKVDGLKLEIVRLPGRTPVIFFEVPARGANTSGQTVLLYGHLDKQPEFNGWRSDLGPWTPKLEDGRLYGRGGADDGYAVYAAITALEALDRQGASRPRCVGLIETCEESGSFDLPAIIETLKPRLGDVSLVVCMDSGAGNYEQLWLTTSLRGMVSGVLKVEILTEGIHSGDASGLVPLPFASCARCWTAWRTPAPATCSQRISIVRFRTIAWRKPRPRRASWVRRCGSASPGPVAPTAALHCPPPPTRSRPCSTAPGGPP